jgi:hypothetical protein
MSIIEPRWHLTDVFPPPHGIWFFGRYTNGIMPTYIFIDGPCVSIRVEERDIKVIQHTLDLPPEWRP